MSGLPAVAAFEVHQISGVLGAEVVGLDLSRPMSDETTAQLR